MLFFFQKHRKYFMLLIDLILVNLSLYLAFMIRFDWHLVSPYLNAYLNLILWASVLRLATFMVFGLYQWSFRFASLSEAFNVIKAVTVGTFMLVAVAYFGYANGLARSVLIIDYLLCLFLVGSSRFSFRIMSKLPWWRHATGAKALIIGAGAAGVMVARELMHQKERLYFPIGFIDDDPRKWHASIQGIRVLGSTGKIKQLVQSLKVEVIIIAIPSASGKTVRQIVGACENLDVKIKTVPGLHQILTGEVAIQQLREVKPEDLLGRESVEINRDDLRDFIQDKVVLVTGAGGTIGSELCRQIVKFNPYMLVAFDHDENNTYFLDMELKEKYPFIHFKTIIGDIKDIGLLKHTFTKYKPNIIFHSAAHKHVPLMEANPAAAVKNNIIGTRNFMYAAEHYGVERFVMISSDKAVNPTSVMGASKRIAEMIIQAKAKTARTKFSAVRFGNVIGSSGSVVPIFKHQIEKGGPVTVTHPEVKRYFMAAGEAAQLVLEAGAIGKGGEIFILDMGEPIEIKDLARNLITLSGLEVDEDIEIKYIGLRPGEKMHEELLLDAENDQATQYDKVFIAKPKDLDQLKLRREVKELERFAHLMDEEAIIRKMKEMVSNYHRPAGHFDHEFSLAAEESGG